MRNNAADVLSRKIFRIYEGLEIFRPFSGAKALAFLLALCILATPELRHGIHAGMEKRMEAVKLFGNFCYGMAAKELEMKTGARPDPRNGLILDAPEPIMYLDLNWTEQFFLNNQAQLQQVVLIATHPVSRRILVKALIGAGWQPAFFETDSSVFDRLQEAKTQGAEQAAKLASEFVNTEDGAAESLSISFLATEVFAGAIQKGEDFNQAIEAAGECTVVIRLMAARDMLKLSFTAPLLARSNALRYGQMIRRS